MTHLDHVIAHVRQKNRPNSHGAVLLAEIERLRAENAAWQLIDIASKDDGVAVLLWDRRDVFAGYWEASCDFWAVSDGGCAIPVPTHWMPMPKPPAEDTTVV